MTWKATKSDDMPTFAEIAKAMGETERETYHLYQRALYKLKKNPGLFGPIIELITERERLRPPKIETDDDCEDTA
jgi:hypothetical protein